MLTTQEKQPKKPHAICIPFPAQGHINPMLKLAIILHHKGFHITFVNTEYNHNRLVNSRGKATVQGSPGFQFATIPDGLPPSENGGDATQDIPTLCHSTSNNCLDPLNELIDELNDSNTGAPPVSCVVTDGAMSFGLQAAERIGVPGVVLRTASVARFMCHMYFTDLMEKGLVPLKDESYLTNGYLDTPIDWIPGLIPLCLRDFSTFIHVNEKDNMLLNFIVSETKLSSKASAVIANTFDDLEQNVLAALSPISPPIYTIGPLHLLFEKLIPESNSLKWMSSSLWKEEPACLEWLDTKPESSVIYVNFGSITVLTAEQLIEFAYGLAESKKNFLWIVRPDLVQGKDASLPVEYWEEVGEKGHVVGWCPQEKVLNHPAIGGFLTHCGWNSILESLCSGVPMLCWPFFADQQVNCRYLCDEWGVGMAINGNVKRDEVGFLVKELLDGEKGKMMKAKAMEWMEKARKAISSGGSSNHNLEKLVEEVLNI